MTRRRNRTEGSSPDAASLRRRLLRVALGVTLGGLAIAAALPMLEGGWLDFGASAANEARTDAKTRAETQRRKLAREASQASAHAHAPDEIPPFARAPFQEQVKAIGDAFRQGRVVEGEILLRRALSRWPEMQGLRIAMAQLRVRQGQLEAAEAELKAAAHAGYRDVDRLKRSAAFAPLRGRPGFKAVLADMRAPAPDAADPPRPAIPTPIDDREAVVSAANTEWSPEDGVPRAYFMLPPEDDAPVMSGDSPAATLFRELRAAGQAAGNRGDFYENLDADHSRIGRAARPQVTHLEHAPEIRAQGYGRGAATGIAISADGELYPPLFGNASLAIAPKPNWRSMARHQLTRPGGPQELWREYASNQIYVYPEHKDHDGFYGDVFSANTPYMIVTQGSSGSDKPALFAIADILAAFRPDTKRELIRRRMIAPVIQSIWRQGQEGIETEADYYSPAAHPPVFDTQNAEPLRMIKLANALTPESIPPLTTLQVVDEQKPVAGVEIFGDGLSQTGFDTPSAISRLFRGTGRTMSLQVAAAAKNKSQDGPARFRWVVLRGDPDKVRVTPLDEAGSQARIEVDWQDEVAAPPRGLRSHRVDIAVFAQVEGAAPAAPAFVSIAFPPHQERDYDAAGRPKTIVYDGAESQAEYSDPKLWPARNWRDIYVYDAAGRPAGWRRGPVQGYASERYTRHGAAVIATDARDRPTQARIMAYPVVPSSKGPAEVQRVGEDRILSYSYDAPHDRSGYATPKAAPPSDSPIRNPTR